MNVLISSKNNFFFSAFDYMLIKFPPPLYKETKKLFTKQKLWCFKKIFFLIHQFKNSQASQKSCNILVCVSLQCVYMTEAEKDTHCGC